MRQKKHLISIVLSVVVVIVIITIVWMDRAGLFSSPSSNQEHPGSETENAAYFDLLQPAERGMLLEDAMHARRSVRQYADQAVQFDHISQILWSVQGITDESTGFRTVPSAGALYPLEIYLIATDVVDLPMGLYHYDPVEHRLRLISEGDYRNPLYDAALEQAAIMSAPASIVIVGVEEVTSVRYGDRSMRYIYLEAGHAGQNLSLQVCSLDMGTVAIGAFNDQQIQRALYIPEDHTPIYIFPIGYLP